MIETDSSVVVVGGYTRYAAEALRNYVTTEIGKPIRWVIIADVMESSWSEALTFYTGQPLTVSAVCVS